MERVLYLGLVGCLLAYAVCYVRGECGDPDPIDNATNDADGSVPYPEGTIVNYTCNAGFERLGITSYTCTGGQWLGGNLVCNQIYCTNLDPPENGGISNSPTNIPGTVVDFICDTGYDLSGSVSLQCDVDGQWSGSPPVCDVVKCLAFPEVPNGETFQDTLVREPNVYGSVVEITCNHGFVLTGNTKSTCQANGDWSQIPQCEIVTCGSHPGLNSTCIENVEFFENLLYILCDKHGNFTGQEYSDECQTSSQTWADPGMTCLCWCHIEQDSNIAYSNLDSDGYIAHGAFLQWECSSGTKNTTANLQCWNGHLETPGCITPSTTPITVTTTTASPSPVTRTSTESMNPGGTTANMTVPEPSPPADSSEIVIIVLFVVILLVIIVCSVIFIVNKDTILSRICRKNKRGQEHEVLQGTATDGMTTTATYHVESNEPKLGLLVVKPATNPEGEQPVTVCGQQQETTSKPEEPIANQQPDTAGEQQSDTADKQQSDTADKQMSVTAGEQPSEPAVGQQSEKVDKRPDNDC